MISLNEKLFVRDEHGSFCEELGLDFSGLDRDKLQAVANIVINLSDVIKWEEFFD